MTGLYQIPGAKIRIDALEILNKYNLNPLDWDFLQNLASF